MRVHVPLEIKNILETACETWQEMKTIGHCPNFWIRMNLAIAVGYSQRKVPFWTLPHPSLSVCSALANTCLLWLPWWWWRVGCDQPLKEPQQTGMFKCECFNSTINSKSGLVTQETEYYKLMTCQYLEVETV